MQSKRLTAIEAATMAVVGYLASVFGQMLIFWFFDLPFSLARCIWIGAFFSVVSFIKNFIIRRIFTKLQEGGE